MRKGLLAPANRLFSNIMDRLDGTLPQAVPAAGPLARGGVQTRNGNATALIVAAVAVAIALSAISFFAGDRGETLILGLLALLGIVGIFFLFATSVGFVRFGFWEETGTLEHLLERSPDGVLVIGTDGRVLKTNAAFLRLCGPHGEAGLATIAAMFAASDIGEKGLFRLTGAAKIGQSAEETIRITARDQAKRWDWPGPFRISVRTLESDDGVERASAWQVTRVRVSGGTDDVAGERFQRDVAGVEKLPVGVVIATAQGRVVHMNARLRSLTGLSNQILEARNMSLKDLFGLDGRDLMASDLSRGGPVFHDIEMPASNGESTVFRVAFRRQDEADGRLIGVVQEVESAAPVADISEAHGANLFSSAPIAIAVVGTDGRINSANSAFARMFYENGKNKPEARGNILTCVGIGSQLVVKQALAAASAGRTNLAPVDITVGEAARKMGRLFVSPISRSPDGSKVAIVYAIDITKQRELEAQFAQSQKMQAVGQLAGGMAHDFNNLLTIITLSSDFLLSSHRKSDPAFKDIMAIKQVAGRAAGIVGQLLAFSRQQTLQPETLSLTDEISDWSTSLRPLLGERVTLTAHHGRDLWFVKADKIQLGQVIMNLAVNARDAMTDGGSLTISTRNVSAYDIAERDDHEMLAGEYVLCEVKDTGSGMPEDVRAKIFDPFFSTKEVGKGTGLGLSTVYGIIKQTGGFIFCNSKEGAGTTFRIYLPRHIEEAPAAATADRGEAPKDGPDDLTGSGVVLLVEDEEPVRRLAARALTRQGFEVLQAGSGAEALEVIESHNGQVDLVVSDIVMPEMDGPTLLKELRSTMPDMKIMFISGYAEDALKSLDGDEEFAFLPKPFQLADLVRTVKDTLNK